MNDSFEFTIRIKKRTVVIFLSVILVIVVLLISSVLYLKSRDGGTLIVRGKIVKEIPVELDPPQVNMWVPVVALLQELGYSTQQQDENIIIISDDDQRFELNLEQLTLYEMGERNFNYLESPPGSYWAWSFRDGNDVIIDATTLSSALVLMDCCYRIADIPKYETVIVYKMAFA